MIPVKLTLKGLYSYREAQEIDFTQLTEAAIFGIFGKVGSGKSSILEAITFALYGNTDRMGGKEDRNYNMMNLRSDELLIDYVCQAGKQNHTYRFTVKGRRNGKRFSVVNTFERKAYQWMTELQDWSPIEAGNAAEKIIGLSYENFKRTIIIPQGRFQEFLDLSLTDRTKMMNEIFQLEKYDLAANVKVLKEANERQLEHLTGQLAQLGQSTPEAVQQVQATLHQNQLLMQLKQTQLIEKQEDEKNLSFLAKLFKNLKEAQQSLAKLEQNKTAILAEEQQLKAYQEVLVYFKPLLEQQQTRLNEQQRDKLTLEKQERLCQSLQASIQTQEQQLLELTLAFNQKEQWKKEAEALTWVLKYKGFEKEIQQLIKNRQRGDDAVLQQKQTLQSLKESKLQLEQALLKARSEQIDVQRVSEVAQWFAYKNQLLQEQHSIVQAGKEIKQTLDNHEQTLAQLWQEPTLKTLTSSLQGATFEQKLLLIQNYRIASQQQIETLQEKIAHLETQRALQNYALALKDHEPCPLCGAVHHPHKLNSEDDLGQRITQEKKQIKALQAQIEALDRIKLRAENIQENIQIASKERDKFVEQYKVILHKIQQYETTFTWTDFSPTEEKTVKQAFDTAKNQGEAIRLLEKQIQNQDQQLMQTQQVLDEKYLPALQKIDLQLAHKNSELQTAAEQISVASLGDFTHTSEAQIKAKQQSLEQQYQQVTQQYEQLIEHIQAVKSKYHLAQGQVQALLQNAQQHEAFLLDMNHKIQQQLDQSAFANLGEIYTILQQKIAVEQTQQKINTFKQVYHSTQQQVQQLLADTQGLGYNEGIHEQLKQNIGQLQTEVNELRKTEGSLQNTLQKLEQDLAAQATLLETKTQLELRKNDIDTLSKLFKSAGFVSFVSGMYLQDLCNLANVRFSKMTRQQLQLEIYEVRPAEYDFQVRDLLNEGRTRAVKTLSGGQKFQVALSLALALADHIHAQTQSQHNFFFLDEGFGSLDKDALVEVFETLKALRKENRIVGVISHVEELQQEIDRYLKVTNHPDYGSIIELV